MTSENPSVKEILNALVMGQEGVPVEVDYARRAIQALAQREEDLLTYLAEMYALPVVEVLKTAAMWREKKSY